jgi:hypothetical protein
VRFNCRECPRRPVIERLVKKFEQTDSVIDNRRGVVGRKECVRMPEIIAHAQEVLTRSPRKSAKRLSQQLGLKQTYTLTNVRQDLKRFPAEFRCNNP